MSLLILLSRSPKSPPWIKCLNLRVLQPPVGLESLKGHRKFDAYQTRSANSQKYLVIKTTYLLEVGASSDNFVDKIFHREDVVFAKGLFNDSIVGERDPLLVDLAVSTLVDKLANGLQIGLPSCADESL
jgi:hypothetical protein